jgi:hypothetical protein
VYGFAMMVQMSGRIIGGALAIPLIAYGSQPGFSVLALGLPFLILAMLSATELKRLEPEAVSSH